MFIKIGRSQDRINEQLEIDQMHTSKTDIICVMFTLYPAEIINLEKLLDILKLPVLLLLDISLIRPSGDAFIILNTSGMAVSFFISFYVARGTMTISLSAFLVSTRQASRYQYIFFKL